MLKNDNIFEIMLCAWNDSTFLCYTFTAKLNISEHEITNRLKLYCHHIYKI